VLPGVHGVGEELGGIEPVMSMDASPRQNQVEPLTGTEVVRAVQARQGLGAAKVHRHVRVARRARLYPVERRGKRSVARLDIDSNPYGSLDHLGRAHQLAPARGCVIGEVGAGAQGQGVRDPDRPGRRAHLGDQHPGVWHVPLPRLAQLFWRHREVPAVRVVEQRAEHRVGVEAWQAEPWDAAVEAHQSRRLAVPDEAEIL
jgi:hypothetical protein